MIVYKVLHMKRNGNLESAIVAKPFCLKYGINQTTKSKEGNGGILCFEDFVAAQIFYNQMYFPEHKLFIFECLVNKKNRAPLPIKTDFKTWNGRSCYGSGFWPEQTICFKQIKVLKECI
jgi:hypothetical protein